LNFIHRTSLLLDELEATVYATREAANCVAYVMGICVRYAYLQCTCVHTYRTSYMRKQIHTCVRTCENTIENGVCALKDRHNIGEGLPKSKLTGTFYGTYGKTSVDRNALKSPTCTYVRQARCPKGLCNVLFLSALTSLSVCIWLSTLVSVSEERCSTLRRMNDVEAVVINVPFSVHFLPNYHVVSGLLSTCSIQSIVSALKCPVA